MQGKDTQFNKPRTTLFSKKKELPWVGFEPTTLCFQGMSALPTELPGQLRRQGVQTTNTIQHKANANLNSCAMAQQTLTQHVSIVSLLSPFNHTTTYPTVTYTAAFSHGMLTQNTHPLKHVSHTIIIAINGMSTQQHSRIWRHFHPSLAPRPLLLILHGVSVPRLHSAALSLLL